MFLQLVGTAMGMKLAPPYACIRVGYLEELFYFQDHYHYSLY